jgi:hypothetical protein
LLVPSAESRDDSLGGGVGGWTTVGASPRDSARLSSRRICGSRTGVSLFGRVETDICLLGMFIGSGLYSLTLRFRVCCLGGWFVDDCICK